MRQPIKRGKVMAEINIAPFTDVVLVLLIIFMVTTPLVVQSGIKINLPKSGTMEEQPQKPLQVAVSGEGRIYLNKRSMTVGQLETELTARASNNPDVAVVVNADRKLPYNDIIRILDIAKRAGVRKLALGVEFQNEPR